MNIKTILDETTKQKRLKIMSHQIQSLLYQKRQKQHQTQVMVKNQWDLFMGL